MYCDPKTALTILILVFAGCTGRVGGRRPSSTGERTTMMSGGTPAAPGQFPATVYIPDCTASKVGPRHFLTAAHCVVDRQAMAIEATFRPEARLAIYTGVNLAEQQTRHLLTVRRTSIHPSYAEKLGSSEGQGVDKDDYARVFDLALIEVEEETSGISAASLDSGKLGKGDRIAVGGYGIKVDTSPFGSGSGGAVIVEGDAGLEPGPTHRLDFALTSVDGTDGTVQLVRNGYTIEGIGRVLSGGLFADQALKLLPGDSGGAVLRDDRPEGANPEEHAFTTIVGVNSFTGLTHSAFCRVDDQGPGACLRSALAGDGEHVMGALPLLCAP